MDCVLLQDGKALQIFRGTLKQELCFKVHEGETAARAIFPQEMIDAIIEVADGTVQEGATYADGVFTNPQPARRLVLKSVIVDRLASASLLTQARAALDAASLYDRERWNSRDSIYSDDPTAVALLTAIGADLEAILAP